MSGDEVIFEEGSQVYRVATASGALVGAEYGGNPLAFDDARQATDVIERRRELAEDLAARKARP